MRAPCFFLSRVVSLLPVLASLSFVVGGARPLQAQRAVGSEMVKLTFPNADVRDVLAQYELLVGKHLIYDNMVTGTVNINVPEVPKDVAIRIIEITLIMNGFHVIPVDSDPTLLKVLASGRPPRSVGIPLIADPEPIPDNEQVVMYLVKLQYADPNEMAQVLAQAMPASKADYGTSVVPLPKAQSLLITENTTIIRTLQRIIRAADVRPTEVEGEFITLQRASAKDVVQMLEKLFEKPAQTGATPQVPRPVPTAPAQNAGGQATPPSPTTPSSATVEIGGMTEDSMISGKVRLTADERTNRIYVVSRPVNLPLLRKLIQDFDEDVRFDEPAVRLLKYVSSGDILEALVKAISDPGNKEASGATGASPRATGAGQNPPPAAANSMFGNASGGRGGGSSSLSSNLSLQTEARIVTPNTVLVGNARVMADNRRNAIIVIGSADVREKVFKLLDQLDVRAPQVMLSTVIGELTLGNEESLGLNFLLNNGARSALSAPVSSGTSSSGFTGPITIADGVPKINLQQLLSDTRFSRMLTAGTPGINGFVAAGNSMSAIVTALETTGRFKVTSRPSVFASNNKKATIASGDEVAVATNIQSGLTGTGANPLVTNSNVSYKPIELRLEVVPLINSDREVYLDIFQQVQEQTDTTIVDNNRYPRISTRALNTSVMVPNEGTLVLGGLIKQSREKTTGGIPFLSRAPLIGPLFRSSQIKDRRTELVIMIRPSVTLGPEEDIGVRDRNMRPMQIPANIEETLGEVEPGKGKAKPVSVPFRSAADVVRPVVVNPPREKGAVSAVPVRQ